MKYKLKNGSEITTIEAKDNVRSARSKYVWLWNEEIQEFEQHIIEPNSTFDKYLQWRDYYKHCPDSFIAMMPGIKLKWYQKLWLKVIWYFKR